MKIKNSNKITAFHKKLEKLFSKYKITYKITNFDPHISLAWNMKKEMDKQDLIKTIKYLKKQKFSFNEEYILNNIFIHEQVGKNEFRLVKILK